MVYVYIFTRTFLFFFGMMVESIPSLSYGHGRMDEHISAVRARNDMNSFSKPHPGASPSTVYACHLHSSRSQYTYTYGFKSYDA